MGTGIPLGRWFGVRVSANWSVLVTLLLFTYMLADSVFPVVHAGSSKAAYWIAAIATSVVFFVTLLAHELAHAVAAKHYGMPVRSITLWLMGGMTDLAEEPPTPRADAVIAAVGPLTSLALGGVGIGLAAAVGSGLTGASLAWLGSVNVILAVFNLLPGAPLDGGRLLRAVLWMHYRDHARAAAAAARTGRGLGIALCVLGWFEFLYGGIAGLWLVLLGWFIMSAATVEQRTSRSEKIRGVTAGHAMTPLSFAAPDWWTVAQLLGGMPAAAFTEPVIALVDWDGQAHDLVTLRQLETVPAEQRADIRLREVAARVRARPLLVGVDADVAEIAPQLVFYRGVALVRDDGRPVGVITGVEIARAEHLAELGRQPVG
jgi:Zn-dependent protease